MLLWGIPGSLEHKPNNTSVLAHFESDCINLVRKSFNLAHGQYTHNFPFFSIFLLSFVWWPHSFWLWCPSVCLSFLGKYFTLHMQNQKHFLRILWTLRKHNFLSLALHIYSFRLKLLSPEIECLYNRLFLSEP